MKYIVDVTDISRGTIEVDAGSIEEAETTAQDLYFSGEIQWSGAAVTWKARPHERKRGGGQCV